MVEPDSLHSGPEVGTADPEPSQDRLVAPSLGGGGPPSDVPSPLQRYRKRKFPSELEVEAALELAVAGFAPEKIAEVLGVKNHVVIRYLKTKLVKDRVREMKAAAVVGKVQHLHELERMLPKSRKAIKTVFETGDVKETRQMAQWLHEAVISKPAQQHELKIQGKIEHDLTPVFEQIGQHLSALREANQHRNPLARVQIGTEKLVRAIPSGDEK